MKKYVVDVSVVLFALLEEDEKIAARFERYLRDATKKKIEIWSTTQLMVEVANGLRFSLKDLTKAREVFESFRMLPIQTFTLTNTHTGKILELSYQLQTTVYDTSYHYISQLLGATFLTCDYEYYTKAKELGGITLLTSR